MSNHTFLETILHLDEFFELAFEHAIDGNAGPSGHNLGDVLVGDFFVEESFARREFLRRLLRRDKFGL